MTSLACSVKDGATRWVWCLARLGRLSEMTSITEAVCYGCDNTGAVDLHCELDWRECEDGPGLHFHSERCYVCGGEGGPVTFEVADYPEV